jgi:hypothetical protein
MLNRPTPACRGAIDIAAAAPQSHNGGRSLVEYLVQSQRHDAVSVRTAHGWGTGSAAADAVAGLGDDTPLLPGASR